MTKKKENKNQSLDRRDFIRLGGLGVGAGILGLQYGCSTSKKVAAAPVPATSKPVIQGFDDKGSQTATTKVWTPVSDKKIRVGLVGYGLCTFAGAFSFQTHPNVEVVAVSDLFPDRCAKLAERAKCNKTYSSGEELIRDKNIDAVFIATDPPSHVPLAIQALTSGKHVATSVPAVWGSLEDAEKLFETVKRTGLKYMMFETSMFRANNYEMRQLYNAGTLGTIMYAEGEYWHYSEKGLPSYKGWRDGMPPQWYPTHSDAYFVGVTGGSFLEVSCLGIPSKLERYKKNAYNNPFGTEITLYRTSEGGIARTARSSDSQGGGYGSETGRVRGDKASYYDKYQGPETNLPDLERPALPPGVLPGEHGGSHGLLMSEFIESILMDRKPLVDIATALNLTVGGIVAHQSALKGGEWLKIPQYKL